MSEFKSEMNNESGKTQKPEKNENVLGKKSVDPNDSKPDMTRHDVSSGANPKREGTIAQEIPE